MYLLLIVALTLIMPLLVMPRDISAGKKSPYRIVLQGTLAVCVVATVVFMAASLTGEGVFSQLQRSVQDLSEAVAKDPGMVKTLGLEEMEQQERADLFEKLYYSILQELPAQILALGAIVSYGEYLLISRTLGKRRQVKYLPKLREFSFPRGAVMGIVGMYLAAWLMAMAELPAGEAFYANMNFIFDVAFSLQGLSVVLMLFHMKRIPRWLGVLLALILWITVFGRMMLVLLGMVDMILGLKERIQKGPSAR